MTPGDSPIQAIADVLDSLGIALCVYDDEDGAVLWNSAFLVFFPEHASHIHTGEHYAENLRRFYRVRLGTDELPQLEDYVAAGLTRHRAQQSPFSFQHRGRWLRVASLPLPGRGRVRIWTDTAAPSAEAAVAVVPAGQELQFAHLLEHMADGIMVVDGQGLIRWVNDRFLVLYGVDDKTGAVGQRFESVYTGAWAEEGDAHAGLQRAGRTALADHMAFTGASFQLPLPGDRWVRVVAQQSSEGVHYFVHVDITQLERRRRDLTEKTLQLETTLSSIGQGILMIDASGRLTVWNQRLRELLDLPEALLATRPTLPALTDFQRARGDFGEAQQRVDPHARAYVSAPGDEAIPTHYLRTTRDGRVIEVLSQSLAGGGLVRTFSDVTDYVRVKDELQRLNDELEDRVLQRTAELQAANRELEAFSYSIAHDLRQPLSSIDGFSTLLAGLIDRDTAGDKAAHYARRMRAGIRQMSALTDGLLALAQLSRARLEWKDFDLGGAARSVLAHLREAQPERDVVVDIAPGLMAQGAPVLLRQVMENLVGNAWKFTARRAPAHIAIGRETDAQGHIWYFVRDDGAGFDMAYADKLFGAFQRLHSPGEFAGTGIGLATVQRIIERHGGRIRAEGRENEGACFYFTLGAPREG